MKTLLIVIIGALLILSTQKPVTVTCAANCTSTANANCTGVCLTYNSTNLSAEYCLNAATTGTTAVTTCPLGLPLNLQISGCPGGNTAENPGCIIGAGCCLKISASNQCHSALKSSACTAISISTAATCGSCSSSVTNCSATNNRCNKFSVAGIQITQVCVANASLCTIYDYSVVSCQASKCAGACCITGSSTIGVCNGVKSYTNFGVLDGTALCAWGFEAIMIKYLGMALAVGLVLLI